MPRPTLVTKTPRSITLNLARGKAISQTIPEDCTLEVWMRQDGPGHTEWSQSDASRVGKTMVLVSGLAPGTSYHFRSRAGRVAGNWAGAPMRWSAFSVESMYATSGTAAKVSKPRESSLCKQRFVRAAPFGKRVSGFEAQTSCAFDVFLLRVEVAPVVDGVKRV